MKKLIYFIIFIMIFFNLAYSIEVTENYVEKEAEKTIWDRFAGSAISLDNSAGLNEDNPVYTMGTTLAPNFSINDNMSLSASFSISKELTNQDEGPYNHRTEYSDLILRFGYSGIYKEKFTGLKLSGSFQTVFPTSLAARQTNYILAIVPGVSISRSIYGVNLSYGFSFRKNFRTKEYLTPHKVDDYYETDPVTGEEVAYDPATGEEINYQRDVLKGNLISHVYTHTISISYNITEKLNISGNFYINDRKLYDYEDNTVEEVSSANAKTSENEIPIDPHTGLPLSGRVNASSNPSKQRWGSGITLSYNFTNNLSASVGLTTVSPQLDSDAQSYRWSQITPLSAWVTENYDFYPTVEFGIALSK